MGFGGDFGKTAPVSNLLLKAKFLVCCLEAAAERDGSLGGAVVLDGSGLPGLLWDLFSFDYGKNNPRYFCASKAFLMAEKSPVKQGQGESAILKDDTNMCLDSI